MVVSDAIGGCNMRRKYLARLERAPANCNRKGLEPAPEARDGRSVLGQAQVPGGDERDRPDCPGYHGWDLCASCVRRVAIARRHRARQMWLLARDLCTSAALHGMEGRGSAASRTLRLAVKVLRDRAGIAEAERGRD